MRSVESASPSLANTLMVTALPVAGALSGNAFGASFTSLTCTVTVAIDTSATGAVSDEFGTSVIEYSKLSGP